MTVVIRHGAEELTLRMAAAAKEIERQWNREAYWQWATDYRPTYEFVLYLKFTGAHTIDYEHLESLPILAIQEKWCVLLSLDFTGLDVIMVKPDLRCEKRRGMRGKHEQQ